MDTIQTLRAQKYGRLVVDKYPWLVGIMGAATPLGRKLLIKLIQNKKVVKAGKFYAAGDGVWNYSSAVINILQGKHEDAVGHFLQVGLDLTGIEILKLPFVKMLQQSARGKNIAAIMRKALSGTPQNIPNVLQKIGMTSKGIRYVAEKINGLTYGSVEYARELHCLLLTYFKARRTNSWFVGLDSLRRDV